MLVRLVPRLSPPPPLLLLLPLLASLVRAAEKGGELQRG